VNGASLLSCVAEPLKHVDVPMIVFKYSLVILCLFAASCGKEKGSESKAKQESAIPIEYQVVSDKRFFSRPVRVPIGEITSEQREGFAKELESAVDKTSTKFQVLSIRAEAPDKDVIALYAQGGMTRVECESLVQSEVIQRATEIGFRTFACQDKTTPLWFSTPIKNKRGEIRVVQDEKGEIHVVPVR